MTTIASVAMTMTTTTTIINGDEEDNDDGDYDGDDGGDNAVYECGRNITTPTITSSMTKHVCSSSVTRDSLQPAFSLVEPSHDPKFRFALQ